MEPKEFVKYNLDSLISRDKGRDCLASQLGTKYIGPWEQSTGKEKIFSCVLGHMFDTRRTPLYNVLVKNTKGDGSKDADYWSIMVLARGEPISPDTEAEIRVALEALSQ